MSGSPENLWIRGELRIERAVLEAIEADAVRCYPSEACGLVMGPASDIGLLDEAVSHVNEADKYHAMDPETFPRTSKTYFKINELKVAKAMRKGVADGRPVKVIYHSHCDAGAYFSAEDAATFSYEKQLMWPCAFLVVSVEGGEVKDRKLWVHRPASDAFDESTLDIV